MTLETEREEYRRRWTKEGDFRAVIDAFESFQNWGHPLPDWLAGVVWGSLHIAFEKGGAPGKGKTGSFKTRANRQDTHWWRWMIASAWLKDRPVRIIDGKPKKMTRGEALEGARHELSGTPHKGSAEAILASYNKIERLRKKL